MPITLGLNISSLRSQRQLARSSDELSNVFTRLSSGQRINRASDDAAGLAIADSLNADSRVFNQGVRNLNDGISVLNIADGALQELTNITFRLTELAEQAANGTLGSQQRGALDEEAQALKAEYFRIAKTTEFNGRKLFEGNYGALSLQAGYGSASVLSNGLGGAIGDGTFDALTYSVSGSLHYDVHSEDFNGDGNADLAIAVSGTSSFLVALGNGNGTFGAASTYDASLAITEMSIADVNNDGILDLLGVSTAGATQNAISVVLGQGNGSFGPASTYTVSDGVNDFELADFNGDGNLDIAAVSDVDEALDILMGSGDGSFSSIGTTATLTNPDNIGLGDFNGDGIIDIVTGSLTANGVRVFIGQGDGEFAFDSNIAVGALEEIEVGDVNNDGILDVVTLDGNSSQFSILLGLGDGKFASPTTVATGTTAMNDFELGDLNGDGNTDLITHLSTSVGAFLGDGTGSFTAAETFSATYAVRDIAVNDFNNDGVLDVATTHTLGAAFSVILSNTTDGVAPLLDFSLNTIADAKQALSQFTQKLDQLSTQRGQIGAFQSRIEVAEKVLKVSTENFKAAESRIRDADIAQESSQLTRLNILQQSAAAVLGQANLQPQLVLQLLGGGR